MNRTIFIQVTAPTLIIGGLLFVICIAGAWYITWLAGNQAKMLAQEVTSLRAAQELEIRVRQLRFHTFLNYIDPTHPRNEPIHKAEKDFEAALEEARRAANSPQEQVYVRAIAEGYERYRRDLAKLPAELARAGKTPDLHKLADAHPVKHIVDPCQALLEVNQKEMQDTVQEGERVSRRVTLGMILLGLIAPLSGLVSGYGIARGLSRHIYQLSVRVHDVAQRLDEKVGSLTLPGDGDLRYLDDQLQHVVQKVEQVMESWQRQRREMLRAEQLSAVGQLAASVAHEVRNPLTGVKLLIDAALLPGKPRSLTTHDLQVIRDEVARVEKTVKDFLDFARPPVPHCKINDLRDVVEQAVDLVRARSRQQQVTIDVRSGNEPIPANVDAGLLCTVFVNFFINSLDAMPKGGNVEVTLSGSPGGGSRIEIADSGPGIAPEMLGRLFTPFASSKATGTGLGLSISRRIIEEQGGSVTGGNRPEGGARFSVKLPAALGEKVHALATDHR
jgi:signal transduction histidine kinase